MKSILCAITLITFGSVCIQGALKPSKKPTVSTGSVSVRGKPSGVEKERIKAERAEQFRKEKIAEAGKQTASEFGINLSETVQLDEFLQYVNSGGGNISSKPPKDVAKWALQKMRTERIKAAQYNPTPSKPVSKKPKKSEKVKSRVKQGSDKELSTRRTTETSSMVKDDIAMVHDLTSTFSKLSQEDQDVLEKMESLSQLDGSVPVSKRESPQVPSRPVVASTENYVKPPEDTVTSPVPSPGISVLSQPPSPSLSRGSSTISSSRASPVSEPSPFQDPTLHDSFFSSMEYIGPGPFTPPYLHAKYSPLPSLDSNLFSRPLSRTSSSSPDEYSLLSSKSHSFSDLSRSPSQSERTFHSTSRHSDMRSSSSSSSSSSSMRSNNYFPYPGTSPSPSSFSRTQYPSSTSRSFLSTPSHRSFSESPSTSDSSKDCVVTQEHVGSQIDDIYAALSNPGHTTKPGEFQALMGDFVNVIESNFELIKRSSEENDEMLKAEKEQLEEMSRLAELSRLRDEERDNKNKVVSCQVPPKSRKNKRPRPGIRSLFERATDPRPYYLQVLELPTEILEFAKGFQVDLHRRYHEFCDLARYYRQVYQLHAPVLPLHNFAAYFIDRERQILSLHSTIHAMSNLPGLANDPLERIAFLKVAFDCGIATFNEYKLQETLVKVREYGMRMPILEAQLLALSGLGSKVKIPEYYLPALQMARTHQLL